MALNSDGDRDFSFYRNFGADVFLEKEDIKADIIKNSRIFHFGSLSLTAEPARSTTEYALDIAKKAGCTVTYDPNYREPLWKDKATAIKMMKLHLDKVDILKIAKDELLMLFGGSEESTVKAAFSYGVKIILVTDGAKGAELYMENAHIALPAEKVNTIDTTGAGDIFFGTFLSEWINNKSTAYNITPETAEKYLKKAIYVAGKSTEKHGAIAALKEI